LPAYRYTSQTSSTPVQLLLLLAPQLPPVPQSLVMTSGPLSHSTVPTPAPEYCHTLTPYPASLAGNTGMVWPMLKSPTTKSTTPVPNEPPTEPLKHIGEGLVPNVTG